MSYEKYNESVVDEIKGGCCGIQLEKRGPNTLLENPNL